MKITSRSHAWRRRALLGGLTAGAMVVLARGFQLQVVEGDRWSERAEDQHRRRIALPAPRGAIYDRNGVPLAVSREAYRVAVAPGEVRNRDAAESKLREVLGVSAAVARRAVDPRRRWVVLPGRYDAGEREALADVRGVHFESIQERLNPHGAMARELIGRVGAGGRGAAGLEFEFDSLLAGQPGAAVARRTATGATIPGSLITIEEPTPGHDIYLTIDHGLQEIGYEVLERAVEQTGAAGGDLVLADPRTGEVLAAVTVREEDSRGWRGAIEPYEPGSTIKPFTVAMLLAERAATMEDSIFAENGRYVDGGRTITDVRGHGWLTLADALRVSSNIAMAKVVERLDPATQFVYLRDFGFGTPTGIAYPSESSGRLRRPDHWSGYSQASLAIGYELTVTPLQMVMAYGALANGGTLMEPRLVREVRRWDGRTVRRLGPQAVRRVVPDTIAAEIAETLVDIVETGGGHAADLDVFRVAGKTGTSRQYRGGRYELGSYNASFAGFFPARDPQLVFLVRLDRPRDEYYGGQAAAPVMRSTLAAALAARSTVLDRGAIASSVESAAAPRTGEASGAEAQPIRAATLPPRSGLAGEWRPPATGPFIFALNAAPPQRYHPVEGPAGRVVPDVVGLAQRDAARRLHVEGFRVEVVGHGAVRSMQPAAGRSAEPGSVVRIIGREPSP